MRDKKNFSTLGKIDEKFVEEAESYSVSETEKAKAKRKSAFLPSVFWPWRPPPSSYARGFCFFHDFFPE